MYRLTKINSYTRNYKYLHIFHTSSSFNLSKLANVQHGGAQDLHTTMPQVHQRPWLQGCRESMRENINRGRYTDYYALKRKASDKLAKSCSAYTTVLGRLLTRAEAVDRTAPPHEQMWSVFMENFVISFVFL